jgi:uncharacterized OsmC-like protein
MVQKSGGSGSGPNPGVLGRASLASCLAISYAMLAARREIALKAVEVDVEADYDMNTASAETAPATARCAASCA